jgi:hypothetical protein
MANNNRDYLPTVPNGYKWAIQATLTFGTPPVELGEYVPDFTNPPATMLGGGYVTFRQFIVDENFLRVNRDVMLLAAETLVGNTRYGAWSEQ